MSSGSGPCEDVLREIIERISLHSDILCCAVVCKQWRSIVMDNLHRIPHMLPLSYCLPQQHLPPLLMHFTDDEVVGKVNFSSVLYNKSFSDFFVPEITGKWIAGSSNGCLVLTEFLGKEIKLLNPLTRAQISLPSFFDFKCRVYLSRSSSEYKLDKLALIRKAIIIPEHNSRNLEDCIVIAIISIQRALSFCRPGDDKWTDIKGCSDRVMDVIYFKNQLYAVFWHGILVSIDAEHHECATRVVAGFTKTQIGNGYLVESTSGNLLLVMRYFSFSSLSFPIKFAVYKLEEVDNTEIEVPDGLGRVKHVVKYAWVRMKSLDDEILFLGRSCMSVPASLYPDLKGNRIYFTDEDQLYKHALVARAKVRYGEPKGCEVEEYDMGIYDMEQKSVQPIGCTGDKLSRVPPVWVQPNLWLKNN